VAIVTLEAGSMTLGIIRTDMLKDIRCPGCRAMAFHAISAGNKVIHAFTRCSGTVVTASTGSDYAIVIDVNGLPGGCIMAAITLASGRYMGRVFTRSGCTVMAARAATEYRIMIDPCHGDPGQGVMAVVAGIRALDMQWVFTRRSAAVVTVTAGEGANNRVGMLHGCW